MDTFKKFTFKIDDAQPSLPVDNSFTTLPYIVETANCLLFKQRVRGAVSQTRH